MELGAPSEYGLHGPSLVEIVPVMVAQQHETPYYPNFLNEKVVCTMSLIKEKEVELSATTEYGLLGMSLVEVVPVMAAQQHDTPKCHADFH